MELMVLVSKQHKVNTKHKMQATPHFSLLSSLEKRLSYNNAGQVGFAAGQVYFQVTCLARRESVDSIFDACLHNV